MNPRARVGPVSHDRRIVIQHGQAEIAEMEFFQLGPAQKLQQLRFVPLFAVRENVVKLVCQITRKTLQVLSLDQAPGLLFASDQSFRHG
ncbi:MAG: hypothetical protein L0Z50_06045 [Verrucomicrobiales bacterium]|nr:hypothetical protein [Verrucomicrobiales bacterium]